MADSNSSSLGDFNLGEVGAALAAAGNQGVQNTSTGPNQGAVGPANTAPLQSLDFILDIPLKVTAELGRSKMAIRDILQLAQGAVIELSKFAGEPLEVLVNDKLIARGEVVVVNEKFGIRLTDIISPVERIEQLK